MAGAGAEIMGKVGAGVENNFGSARPQHCFFGYQNLERNNLTQKYIEDSKIFIVSHYFSGLYCALS